MSMSKKVLITALALCVSSVAYGAEFKQDEVIVKFKDGFRSRISMNGLYTAAGIKHVKRYSGIMKGYEQLTISENVKLQDAIAELQKSDLVEYVQPNYILRIQPVKRTSRVAPADAPMPCIIPGIPFPPGCQDQGGGNPGDPNNPGNPFPGNPGNPGNPGTPSTPTTRPDLQPAPADVVPPVADPQLSALYGMKKIGATDAWNTFKGSKDFLVADIDTGIDYNHEDLAFNVWRNPNPTQNDVVGFDFVHNDGLPFDDNEHGTHTAGTIGAVGGNGKGVSGVAQRVSIMALKFLSGEGSGTTADAIRAIDYAVAHGAKVLSNSWGGKGDDGNKALQESIQRAADKDVLFVAAAGNDGTDNDGSDPAFPAAFTNDNMITVAATDESDRMAFFSNFGAKTTHLAAPGTNILSTVPGNRYAKLDGTSMACPHVAGAAALVWAAHPKMTYKQIKKILMDSVDPLTALQGKTVTGGRLNVAKALSRAALE